ncbi:MAG: 16S rRNA methyltransferase [Candidatus Thermoplasmatota archaeon]|nr:16S rRNA methyltransferase [Candidatus Thermoplasmatota archaeon]
MKKDELFNMEGGTRLTLLLVDSELELVPREFWSHPAVVQNARKRGKRPHMVLLDSSLHHSLFANPDERNRRGRPDIVHQFLLLSLDSVLNQQRRLGIYVHTRNDQLIWVDPATRLPKNYNRYSGLFEELLMTGSVPSGREPLLISTEKMDLCSSIELIRSGMDPEGSGTKIILLHPEGELTESWNMFSKAVKQEGNKQIICLVGGFSSGDFRSPVGDISDIRVALPGGMLKVWTVISELLVGFRIACSEEAVFLKEH